MNKHGAMRTLDACRSLLTKEQLLSLQLRISYGFHDGAIRTLTRILMNGGGVYG